MSARSTTYLPQKKNFRNIKMSDNVYREMIFKQTIKNQGVIRPTYTKESYLTHYSDKKKGMMSNPVIQSVAAGGLAATVIHLATDAIQGRIRDLHPL